MSKLFRKIRMDQIGGNRVTKYVLYAIGEIALLVIGIMIAVQINNWNEVKQQKQLELQTLKEVRGSIETNMAEMKTLAGAHQAQIEHFKHLVKHMEEDLPYHDSLETKMAAIFGWYTPLFDFAPYETLKTRGVELISNDTVKRNIVAVYEKVIFRITDGLEKFESGNSTAVVLPYFSKHFEMYNALPPKVRANDYERLKKDPEYRNILQLLIGIRTFGVRLSNNSAQGLEAVVQLLDKEIEKQQS